MSGLVQGRPWLGLAIALCLLLAPLAQLPHLGDDAWEDEAATLLLFAGGTPLDAFRDYRLPNNHMLFSATLAAWWSRGDSVLHARLLPGGTWLLSMALMLWAGRRTLGWHATALGLALWSGAALTGAFAIALRGYAFSWPFVLVLFATAPAWVRQGAWRAGLVCALAGALAIMILPTNVMVLAACLAWALLEVRDTPRWPSRGAFARALAAGLVAALGLLVYLPHRAQIAAFVDHGFSQWSTAQVMGLWTLASSGQFWPLAPLLAWGAWRATRDADAREALSLLLALVSISTFAVALSPTPLVPRALLPLLPLWCLALGGLLTAGARALAARGSLPFTALLAGLVLLGFACGRVMPACAGLEHRFPPGEHVCHQYYRQGYHPAAMLAAIARQYPNVPVLVPRRESFAFSFAQWNGGERGAQLLEISQWQQHLPGRLPRLVVATSPAAAREALARLTPTVPGTLDKLLDAGALVLYAPRWP